MPETLIKAFKKVGFENCDNLDPEPYFDKVLLYKRQVEYKGMPIEIWSHASRIISRGVEHCKFGQDCDGTHSSGMVSETSPGLEELGYGNVYCCLKRRKGYIFETTKGEIEINIETLENLI